MSALLPVITPPEPGVLAAVPRHHELAARLHDAASRQAVMAIQATMGRLGRAVQFSRHRAAIDELDAMLSFTSLLGIASAVINDREFGAAMSVYMTTLEQSYHWPRDIAVSTPNCIEDYKIVVQILHQPELREHLRASMRLTQCATTCQVVQAALNMGRWMIEEGNQAAKQGAQLHTTKQDRLNLLYRTCRNDWYEQGDYGDHNSHVEFGRLHENIRTTGTQRRLQELFQDTKGLAWLQEMPELLHQLPHTSEQIVVALNELQLAVAAARDELFLMMIDETIWGRTFAKWSKATGTNNISSGGADCPMFRMLDALMGRADDMQQAALLEELDFRSRFFPGNMRDLISRIASAPSLRSYIASGHATFALSQAFLGLQQMLFGLYEMHRKKAMRIALALRAGQAKTSSGTEKASSPEAHIARALGAAMRVRFGRIEDSNITAYACSKSLVQDCTGQITSARVRLVLSTPLVVSPGDAVSIVVPVPTDGGQDIELGLSTRTYSIIGIESLSHSPRSCQGPFLANTIEVCVRRKGKVSAFLCDQQSGFPLQLHVHSAPHFRIHENQGNEDETLFVAQAGAVGVFLSWLSKQHSIVGHCRLVVGVQDFGTLPFQDELESIAAKLRPRLKIVVAMSRPRPGGVKALLSHGLKPFVGRANQYLTLYKPRSNSKITTTYICGSSGFGLDVVKSVSGRYEPKASSSICRTSRLRPIVSSTLPRIRMHVAAGATPSTAIATNHAPPSESHIRLIGRTELALHNEPNDMWLALGDEVYNISTVSSFHPGGEKVLMYRAGRQAQDVFNTVHKGSYEVESILSELFIGRLAPVAQDPELCRWEILLDRVVEMQNDLTNNSRFEQTPNGKPEQLDRAPPADVISRTLPDFVRSWSLIVEETEHENLVDELSAALQDASARGAVLQEETFQTHAEDAEMCAKMLKYVFECHYDAIEKVHAAVDEVKLGIHDALRRAHAPEMRLLANATASMIEAIRRMSSQAEGSSFEIEG